MIWRLAWVETRWRFVASLVGMLAVGLAMLAPYPQVVEASRAAAQKSGVALQVMSFHAYAWGWWFSTSFALVWILCACLLSAGGVAQEARAGTILYTLSLPMPRSRLLWVRGAVLTAELAAIALAGCAVAPLAAVFMGQSYPLSEALLFGTSVLLGGLGLIGLAVLISTVRVPGWLQVGLCVLAVLAVSGVAGAFVHELSPYTPLRVMSAWAFVENGRLPYAGWLASAVVAAALLLVARVRLQRCDF